MFKVKNKKAVRNLADKNFRAARVRNTIAVIAIMLTSVLFTALFTIAGSMIENIQRQTMRQAGGDGMGALKYLTEEEYQAVKDHELISEISYNRILADRIENEELRKRHGELYYMDDTAIKLGFCEPVAGRKPEAANEIMMDTRAMQLFGIEKIGDPVSLTMTIHEKEVTRDFVLCGFWEADPVFNASIMVTSRAYMEEHIDELYNSYKSDYDLAGAINCYIMFKNSFGLEEKLARVIKESGFSMDSSAPNYIESNVNWAYMSSGMDGGSVAAVAGVALFIVFTGYLIIYNIFQISVIRDIRFYGLLKTIGTTGKQIKSMIHRQALWLSAIGIPAGLLVGYLAGCKLVPVIMSYNIYESKYDISANPLIFAGSTIFTIFTVLISTAKPGKIAACVSPVEAVRYTDGIKSQKRPAGSRRGQKGAKIPHMAAANLGRNKKRTVLVLLSMSLSLVLFNSIYSISVSFDMDKFLSKFVDTDFLIAHVDYFNYNYGGAYNAVSEEMIEAVKGQPGFEEGGRYLNNSLLTPEVFTAEEPENYVPYLVDNRNSKGYLFCGVYGAEDMLLGRLKVVEGELDIEKLKSGNYILEGVNTDDNENPIWKSSHYKIGDKVVLHNYKGTGQTMEENEFCTWEYEVLAKVAIQFYTNSVGRMDGLSFYLPADIYRDMVAVPGVMNYCFNVQDEKEGEMEAFLKDYTENIDPVMDYRSKTTYIGEFENLRNIILSVGGMLSFIVGLIGLLNFVNSMLTSIITRRREFAMLQSVGMTKRQLQKMLVLEGLYYTAGAGGLSLLLGSLLSVLAVKGIMQGLWFCSYQFTVVPLLITFPVLLIIGAGLPYLMMKTTEKQSIVERLRECE